MAPQALTVLEVLERAEAFLRRQGCEPPRLDAQLLLAHVLECDRVRLYLDYAKPLADGERAAYRELIRRRANREPVAHLTGRREFWSLPLRVDARALIPRPDSETLIEQAQQLFGDAGPERFADVGTGSGCLAAALAHQFPRARGWAVDADADALALARENLRALGLDERVATACGDLDAPLGERRVELLCANLPYVPSAELDGLQPEVSRYEPRCALDGGADGLALLRRFVPRAAARLAPGGWLLLEVGRGQAAAVAGLCREAGLADIGRRPDLGGVERVVYARRVHPAAEAAPPPAASG
jgi:release factor glutamine methyltransferase